MSIQLSDLKTFGESLNLTNPDELAVRASTLPLKPSLWGLRLLAEQNRTTALQLAMPRVHFSSVR